jgi:hypothetical protein
MCCMAASTQQFVVQEAYRVCSCMLPCAALDACPSFVHLSVTTLVNHRALYSDRNCLPSRFAAVSALCVNTLVSLRPCEDRPRQYG